MLETTLWPHDSTTQQQRLIIFLLQEAEKEKAKMRADFEQYITEYRANESKVNHAFV